MKHATDSALDRLADLLDMLRRFANLTEKKRGIFYYKGRACLHFHEDRTGLFADLRLADEWERHPVTTESEQLAFFVL